jgi:hypothetical protein
MWKNFYIHFCFKFWYQAISWLIFSELQNLFFGRLTWAAWRKHHGMCTSEMFVRLKTCKCIIIQVLIDSESHTTCILEPVCCKKQKKSSWPVNGLRDMGPLKDLNDSKLIVYELNWFSSSSRINFTPFRIFRGPLFHKRVTGQELFFTLSFSKPALLTYMLHHVHTQYIYLPIFCLKRNHLIFTGLL